MAVRVEEWVGSRSFPEQLGEFVQRGTRNLRERIGLIPIREDMDTAVEKSQTKPGNEVTPENVTDQDLLALAASTIENRVIQKASGARAAAQAIKMRAEQSGDPRLAQYVDSLMLAVDEIGISARAVQFGLTEGAKTHNAFVDHSYESSDPSGLSNTFDVNQITQDLAAKGIR